MFSHWRSCNRHTIASSHLFVRHTGCKYRLVQVREQVWSSLWVDRHRHRPIDSALAFVWTRWKTSDCFGSWTLTTHAQIAVQFYFCDWCMVKKVQLVQTIFHAAHLHLTSETLHPTQITFPFQLRTQRGPPCRARPQVSSLSPGVLTSRMQSGESERTFER